MKQMQQLFLRFISTGSLLEKIDIPYSDVSDWGHRPWHTPNTAFRHLPPNSARFSYATEGALLNFVQLSSDVVMVPGSRDLEEGAGAGPSSQPWGDHETVRTWSWAAKVGLLSRRVVPQQQCNGHCPCDSAQARQLKQQLRGALVAGQWRGDTALTLPLFWWRSTVSPVFFGRYPRSSLHSFAPPPPPPPPPTHHHHPVPVPNKPPHFCGRKAKWSSDAASARERFGY